ncbi:MAG: hypothetical protein LBU78_05545 [Microbacterium sp.]|nr:hypothetical protein [Microbacterium sp.]
MNDLVKGLGRALADQDEAALSGLLTRTVRLVIDSGDLTGGEWRGRDVVTSVLRDRYRRRDSSLRMVHVNGSPGLALYRPADGAVVGILAIGSRSDEGMISELWLAVAPQKLTSWNRPRNPPAPGTSIHPNGSPDG